MSVTSQISQFKGKFAVKFVVKLIKKNYKIEISGQAISHGLHVSSDEVFYLFKYLGSGTFKSQLGGCVTLLPVHILVVGFELFP